jgi:hypothetical protein
MATSSVKNIPVDWIIWLFIIVGLITFVWVMGKYETHDNPDDSDYLDSDDL